MNTQPDLSAQLNQKQNAAKMTQKAGGELGKRAGGVTDATALGHSSTSASGAVGKVASNVAGKIIGGETMSLLLWLGAIVLDIYGLVALFITTLTVGISEFIEIPAEIGAGFGFKSLLKNHLSQVPELNKLIFIITGSELIPYLDVLPCWTAMMIYASFKIKQAKEQAQAEQEVKQKQAQIAQRRQMEWEALAVA